MDMRGRMKDARLRGFESREVTGVARMEKERGEGLVLGGAERELVGFEGEV